MFPFFFPVFVTGEMDFPLVPAFCVVLPGFGGFFKRLNVPFVRLYCFCADIFPVFGDAVR